MKNILYIADIHGPKLVKIRKIERNLSFAGTTKVLNIASALQNIVNNIYVYSAGSPAENKFKWYASTVELVSNKNKKKINIQYGFAFDNKFIRGTINFLSSFFFISKILKRKSINIIIIYNLTFINLLIIVFAKLFNLKVLLEYEDSVIASRETSRIFFKSFFYIYEFIASKLIDGVLCPTEKLTLGIDNKVILPGIIGDDIYLKNSKYKKINNNFHSIIPLKIIYAGGFDKSKGIDLFLEAINMIDLNIEMVVVGNGPLTQKIEDLCLQNRHSIKFFQSISRDKLVNHLYWADVGINTHLNIHRGGSWPFKVVEYLATCGTVFSSKLESMPSDLKSKLFLYDGESVLDIYNGFNLFIKKWPTLRNSANTRIAWTLKNYSGKKIGKQIMNLM